MSDEVCTAVEIKVGCSPVTTAWRTRGIQEDKTVYMHLGNHRRRMTPAAAKMLAAALLRAAESGEAISSGGLF